MKSTTNLLKKLVSLGTKLLYNNHSTLVLKLSITEGVDLAFTV